MKDADLLAVLQGAVPGLAAVYVFGSVARGDARADSDLDVAILSECGPIASDARHTARESVEALVGRDVDLVDLAAAPTTLGREALVEGRALFTTPYSDFYEIVILREYEDMKVRRAGIEADIAARGWVEVAP